MGKRISYLFAGAILTLASGASAQSVYPGQHQGKLPVETQVPCKAETFDLRQVRLLPGRVHDNLSRDSAWMANISVERLVHSFKNNAGVYAGVEGGYESLKKFGGWESLDCDLRGHTTGHLMSAYGLMYAATGDKLFKQKGDSIVAVLAEVQEALGPSGYLSAFPEAETTVLTVDAAPDEAMKLHLRYPYWSGKPTVKVNGKKVAVKGKPSSYITVDRRWKAGDRVEVTYPMSLRVETTPDNPAKGAVMYGPVVLAAKLGTEGMEAPAPFSDPTVRNDYYTYDYKVPQGLPTSLPFGMKDVPGGFKRQGKELKFVTDGGLEFSPLYDLNHCRYGVYWDFNK